MARARRWLVTSACALLAALADVGSGSSGPTLQPTFLDTAGLERTLDEQQTLALRLEWPRLGSGPTLELGARGDAVVALRERLAITDEAPAPEAEPERFDPAIEAAVRDFQRRHGLEPDGKVGPETRRELDLGPRERARQIERVIAARRTLPNDLGARFLLVNLPAFTVEAIADGDVKMALRVVVGRIAQPTPTMTSEVRSIVVHPPWNVPPRIARDELAARELLDRGYLERLGFEVIPVGGGTAIDPASVDWSKFQRGEIALRLRQRPGPLNALGAVVVSFPNPHNVALHDTPEQRLFDRSRRAFSHACIRVERARELARWLLAGETPGAASGFELALADEGVTRELPLASPVPIYVVDWPIWVDESGVLQMRPDLYPATAPRGESECEGGLGP